MDGDIINREIIEKREREREREREKQDGDERGERWRQRETHLF